MPNLHTRVFIRAYMSNGEIKFVKFVFIWLLERDIKALSTFASIKNKKCSSFQFINYPILDTSYTLCDIVTIQHSHSGSVECACYLS